MEGSFTEEDQTQVMEFLNMVAKHARFDVDTHELISYFKGLSHMQRTILPKIEKHILEVKALHEAPKRGRSRGTKRSSK